MRSALSTQCLADRAQPLAPAILPIHVVREAVGDARPSLDAKVANLLGLGLGLGLGPGFPSVVEHQSDVPSAAVRPSLTKTPSIPARAFARVNSSGSNLLRSFGNPGAAVRGSGFPLPRERAEVANDRCAGISTPGRRACA